jgi:hypothetical protein
MRTRPHRLATVRAIQEASASAHAPEQDLFLRSRDENLNVGDGKA